MRPCNPAARWWPRLAAQLAFVGAALGLGLSCQGALISFATVPLFVTTPVLPNVLVIMDNSQSMDGTMAGKLIAGDDPSTRGNIGRAVIRNTITSFRTVFNWGLMTYTVTGAQLLNTYAYFLGCIPSSINGEPNDRCLNGVIGKSGMYFTDSCDPTTLTTDKGQRCVQVPAAQAFPHGNYVTYDKSGDDPDVNDVLYTGNGGLSGCSPVVVGGLTYCSTLWGLSAGPSPFAAAGVANTSYAISAKHSVAGGTCNQPGTDAQQWSAGCFTGCPFGTCGGVGFTPTDAGYLPSNRGTPTVIDLTPVPVMRQFYLPRAWGYLGNVNGSGTLVESVQADSTTHFNTLMTLLGSETNANTAEIKNGAVYTPLPGTITAAKNYYTGASSPIAFSCQRNFVMLVTDGLATSTPTGALYTTPQRSSTGQATIDTVNAITALRSVSKSSLTYDVQTYVVGLGDTVANPDAIVAMNKMAAAGGTGTAFLASSAQAFADAISTVTDDIVAKVGSGSAVSLNTGTLSTGAVVYQARFSTGDWSGQLLAFPIQSDGSLGATLWDAGQVVNGQNYSTGRAIITLKASTGKGIAFRWPANYKSPTTTEMDTAQADALNLNASGVYDLPAVPAANSTGYGSQRLDWVRGSTTNEGQPPYNFRPRVVSRLGDIVDSAPFFVGPPSFNYPDSMEAQPYSVFRNTYLGRQGLIWVGANDGMMHGFNATTGREMLAYVPSKILPQLPKLSAPTYSHKYFVDGTATIGDAFINGRWRSILVGGLRSGGRGFYALDVTDPTTFTETNAANLVLWEFTDANDPDMGYAFSQPAIVRLANGRWAAVFGNGYNNSDTTDGVAATSTTGHAVLFFVDLQTGALIKKIDTKVGTVATPNGLATATPVDVNGNYIADYIFAGDLLGNLWKFDVTSSNPNNWVVSYGSAATPAPLFTASDGSGGVQQITERVEVGRHPNGGLIVYFGTGQYLASGDNTTTGKETFYGVWDNGATVAGRNSLLQQTITGSQTASGVLYRNSSTNGNASTMYSSPLNYKGWYMDLPGTGERQVTDPVLNNNRIIFTTLIPNTSPCSFGGNGFLMELDPITGNQPSTAIFDTNNDKVINSSDIKVAGVATSAIASSPGIIDLAPTGISGGGGSAGGSLQRKLYSQSDATIGNVQESGGGQNSKRVMWRQLK